MDLLLAMMIRGESVLNRRLIYAHLQDPSMDFDEEATAAAYGSEGDGMGG